MNLYLRVFLYAPQVVTIPYTPKLLGDPIIVGVLETTHTASSAYTLLRR